MNFSERFNARHARKTDDVVGFQAGSVLRWEPEVSGICHRKDSGIARASVYRERQQRQRLLR